MFRSMLAGVMGSLAVAGAASAEPFQSFTDLCLSTNADRPAAHAAAKLADWVETPVDVGDDQDAKFRDQVLHVKFDSAGHGGSPAAMELLLTGWGDGEEMLGAESVVLEVCGVMSPRMTAETMRAHMTGLLGDRADEDDIGSVWLYSRDGDRFVSEAALADAADGEIEAAARDRDLYVVFAIQEDGMGILMLGAVRSVLRLREGG
jgi:hypothetical protein